MIEVILNRVLVKPEELQKKTESGLLIEYGELEKQHARSRVEGIVVGVGPTAYTDLTEEAPVKIGDHVVFARYAGVFVTDPETQDTLVVLNDTDVLCIVRKGDSK